MKAVELALSTDDCCRKIAIALIDLVVNLTHRKTVAGFRDDVKDCGEKSGVAP